MSDNGIVLQCANLHKSFHDGDKVIDVLRGIDLQVKAGEQLAIVGPSGSGKSTLLHLLGGLDTPSSGTVNISGSEVNHLSEAQRCKLRNQKLGFVYQFHHLLPEFTAIENVAMPLLIGRMSKSQAFTKAQAVLKEVGLDHRLEHIPAKLSGGERQRAALARALVTNPECLLADEPTGNLDQYTAHAVYATLLNLNQQINTSIVIVTHDMRLAEKMDRVVWLDKGVLTTKV